MTTLWDKNGLSCDVDEAAVEKFVELHEHREFSRETKPVVLGCSRRLAANQFVANRVSSMRRVWMRKHMRTMTEAMSAGKAQADAVAEADEKWGADAPSPEAIAAELELPAHLTETEA